MGIRHKGRKAILLAFSTLLICSHYALIKVAKAEQVHSEEVSISKLDYENLLGVKSLNHFQEDWNSFCDLTSNKIDAIKPDQKDAQDKIDAAFKEIATTELRQPLMLISDEDKKAMNHKIDSNKDKLLTLKERHEQWVKEEIKKAEERRKAAEEDARKKRELEEQKAKERLSESNSSQNIQRSYSEQGHGNSQVTPRPKEQKKHQSFCVDELCYTYTETYTDDVHHLQSLIDQDRVVAKGGFAKNNRSTYILGHNPGIMSGIASRLHIGKEFYMHDANGVAHKYRIHSRISTDIYGNYHGQKQYVYPGITPNSALYDGVNEDIVYIQYCFYENGGYDNSYVWVALPA